VAVLLEIEDGGAERAVAHGEPEAASGEPLAAPEVNGTARLLAATQAGSGIAVKFGSVEPPASPVKLGLATL
jgi:hypothetical protein